MNDERLEKIVNRLKTTQSIYESDIPMMFLYLLDKIQKLEKLAEPRITIKEITDVNRRSEE